MKKKFSITIREALLVAICIFTGVKTVLPNALPGEFLISDKWRIFTASHAASSNPAFLMENNYWSVSNVVTYSPDQVGRLVDLSVAVPMGLYQTLGVTILSEFGFPVQDAQFLSSSDSVIQGAMSSNDNILAITSYAINPWDRLSVGANVKGMYSSNFGTDPVAVGGIDIGATYRVLYHPLLGYHLAGVSYQNLLSLGYQHQVVEGNSSQLRFSYYSEFLEKLIEFGWQFDITDFAAAKKEFLDDSKAIEWRGSVDIGVWLLRLATCKLFLGMNNQQKPDYWGLGIGINAPTVNDGRDFAVTYQYLHPVENPLSAMHSIYAKIDIGLHRESVYAKRYGELLSMSANDLYNRALRLYHAQAYWDAYFLFTRIVEEFPDFFKNDWVNYYRGASLEKLDMRNVAIVTFSEVIDRDPNSVIAAHAQLGILRIQYRNERPDSVRQCYDRLAALGKSDSLRYHGVYYLGESAMRQGDYAQAIEILSMIPETHPDFIYAQHTLAVASILKGDSTEQALNYLRSVIEQGQENAVRQEIVNRSLLFAGYLFFEDEALARAVSALRMISSKSYYYEDALLGLCWTAKKARQWNDCISYGHQLASTSKKPILQSEGMLVEAYGRVMQKDFDGVEALIHSALDRIKSFQNVTEDSLSTERSRYERNRLAYDLFGNNVVNLSRQRESDLKMNRAQEMHASQKDQQERLLGFYRFTDEYHRGSYFSRNRSALQGDLEYFLAKVQQLQEKQKTIQGIKKKGEAIDKKLEDLKEELKRGK